MKNKDLLLDDFKKSSKEVKNLNSIKGGLMTVYEDSTDHAHTLGDIGNCDTDDLELLDDERFH